MTLKFGSPMISCADKRGKEYGDKGFQHAILKQQWQQNYDCALCHRQFSCQYGLFTMDTFST